MTEMDNDPWLHEAAKRIELNGSAVPHISYATVSLFIGLIGAIIFGAWSVSQSQLTNINGQIELLRKETTDKDLRLAAELSRRETELRGAINVIQSELDRRRNEFASIKEYSELKDRILDDIKVLRGQLGILEGTRPTTGELEKVSAYAREIAVRLEERVRQLEQSLQRPH